MTTNDVQDRLDALNSYNERVHDYLAAKEAEETAAEARQEVEDELRALVDRIGHDPAKVLPRKRRKAAEKITEPAAEAPEPEADDEESDEL